MNVAASSSLSAIELVEQLAQVGDQPSRASEVTVPEVGERRDQENQKRHQPRREAVLQQERHQQEREGDSAYGNQVRKVEIASARHVGSSCVTGQLSDLMTSLLTALSVSNTPMPRGATAS